MFSSSDSRSQALTAHDELSHVFLSSVLLILLGHDWRLRFHPDESFSEVVQWSGHGPCFEQDGSDESSADDHCSSFFAADQNYFYGFIDDHHSMSVVCCLCTQLSMPTFTV